MRIVFIVMFSTFLFFSCTSQVKVLKPEGETVTIELKNNLKYDGELFAVNDTAVLFGYRAKLYELPLSNINNLYVHDYSLRNTKKITMIPAMSCWVLQFFAEPNIEVKLFSVLMEALIIHSWYIGDPKVNFSPPLNNKDFEKLKLYCRYSQGLTHEKWRQLLQYCEQEEFLRLQ